MATLSITDQASVANRVAMHILGEKDGKESGDIIQEVKAKSAAIGILQVLLAISDMETIELIIMAAKIASEHMESQGEINQIRRMYKGGE